MTTIPETILLFDRHLHDDKNHRYKSWEHCYQYFQEPNPEIENGCLHLSFYLDSRGMPKIAIASKGYKGAAIDGISILR